MDVERAILNGLESDLDEVTLVMGAHGTFRVSVNDELVYDKDEDDYGVDDVVREVRAHL
jgi:selenoprotein W-related protein